MNLTAEVLSISKQSINLQSPKGVPFRVLAFANVKVPELGATFAGIALTHSEHGHRAMAPNQHVRGRNSGEPTIYWRADSPLCKAVLSAILAAYDRLTVPQPKRQFIPLSDLVLSEDEGLPLRERVEDAIEAESRKRGVECYTSFYERSDDEPDDSGLHRTLKVESEICDRAGL